ncbi:hypothetical protein ACTXT7_005600 [Hymenolepis weldensis]
MLLLHLPHLFLHPISDSASAQFVAINIPEFVHDPKSGDFCELWYNKNKYVFMENIAKWDEETRARCLVRKLDPVKQFRCLILISGLHTKSLIPLGLRLLKLMEEISNVKLQEMVREGVKMATH